MKEEDKNIELLRKYLLDDCSKEEKNSVEQWLEQSPDNRAAFESYKRIWSFAGMDNDHYFVDVEKSWEDFNRRIEALGLLTPVRSSVKKLQRKKIVYNLSRIAAIFVVALGLFYLLSRESNEAPEKIVVVAQDISDQPVVLADGSSVFLNQGAEISYPEVFAPDRRMINFEGEAFFDVVHNPDKPFIIASGDLRVEVLGTSFDLCTCPNGDEMVLYLKSGKVRFSSVNADDGTIREQLILTPGQKGIFNKKSGLVTRSTFNNQNYLAWKTGVLEFEKTPLSEVISSIEQTYRIKVISNRSLEHLSLTARFENETPESIFESLQTIFGINYEFRGQTCLIN